MKNNKLRQLILQVKYKTKNITLLRDILVKYRHRNLKPTDIFLAAHQRTGSTWFSRLLSDIISNNDKKIQMIGKTPNVLETKGRRIFKTHEKYREEYNDKKIIYLARDPRDVAVSGYFYRINSGYKIKDWDAYIQDFINGKIFSQE